MGLENGKVYLDYAASSPVDEKVVDAMRPFWTDSFGNPSSIHSPGRRARVALEDARERIAGSLSVDPSDIIFTSGGTEAANLALTVAFRSGKAVMASRAEHECVLRPLEAYEAFGGNVHWMDSDEHAGVVLPPIPQAIDFDGLVTAMLVNNETGAWNDPDTIRRVFPKHKNLYYADAVQALGLYDISVPDLGVDLLSLSAHKIGGPKGIGLLCVAGANDLIPIQRGGSQEHGRRAGTENVAGAVGFARAIELAHYARRERAEHVRKLRDRLYNSLCQSLGNQFVTNSPLQPDESAPHILNIAFPPSDGQAIDGEMLLLNLDLEGVFVSGGSACTSGSINPSHVLLAAGSSTETAAAAVRFSLSHRTTEAELDYAVDRLTVVVGRMRRVQPDSASIGVRR